MDGAATPPEAEISLSAGALADLLVRYAQAGVNGVYAAQAGQAAKRQAEAMGQVVLAAAAVVAARNR